MGSGRFPRRQWALVLAAIEGDLAQVVARSPDRRRRSLLRAGCRRGRRGSRRRWRRRGRCDAGSRLDAETSGWPPACSRRGAGRLVAVDNEQYRLSQCSLGNRPDGAEDFRAVHGRLGSSVEYRQLDAFEPTGSTGISTSSTAWAFCTASRIRSGCSACCAREQRALLETYGIHADDRDGPTIRVPEPGEIYARDDFVYGASRTPASAPGAARGLPTGRGARPGRGRRPPRIGYRLIA